MSNGPIVVGTDGSVGAERAVDRAGELAVMLDVPVHVITVLQSAGEAKAADAAAEQLVTASRDRLEARGTKVQTHIRAGSAPQELIKVAAEEQAQMIVVGNRGMSGARRVLGSVPNDVSHYAPCDVLIVRTED
jgi:nucleotide-binding universal stress UspA family protein